MMKYESPEDERPTVADHQGRMGRPRYKHIEFCTNAETVWRKLQEGRWDWLGVKPDGPFVLGSPPAGGFSETERIVKFADDSLVGQHGVMVQEPLGNAQETWCESEAAARRNSVSSSS
jgi:hypothetical protein